MARTRTGGRRTDDPLGHGLGEELRAGAVHNSNLAFASKRTAQLQMRDNAKQRKDDGRLGRDH